MSEQQPEILTTRLTSLDAFRGFIMLTLISEGFNFRIFEGTWLNFIYIQTHHVEWEGCAYWDLIQPAFTFMVGMAMPFSFAKRKKLGISESKNFLLVLKRCFMLWFVALIFTSIHAGHIESTLINVLPQIAMCYIFASLMVGMSYRAMGAISLAVLAIWHILWVTLSIESFTRDPNAVLTLGQMIDQKLYQMGLITYEINSGMWAISNAVPSFATMVAGIMCGKLVGEKLPQKKILTYLLISAAALIIAGLAISPISPIIKRIWTVSFGLYSTGWCILFLSFFYWTVDMLGYKKWCWFLVVIGMNSIFAYVMTEIFYHWIDENLRIFTDFLLGWMDAMNWTMLHEVLHGIGVTAVQWYVLYVLYKNKIFFKL
jgi:predicted acyltransferase